MTPKPNKWFGQRSTYKPPQTAPRVFQRPIINMRFLKKGPYKVSYGEFSYTVQTVVLDEQNISYIAARMVTASGRLQQPVHEYELSRRFASPGAADEAWTAGFEAKEDEFIGRSLIHRMIEEEAAEVVEVPVRAIP